ncbi:MAG: threonine/serine exporter family protein [Chloroflexi bacterium]|uniref:Threonine/serine exporter family protein n=1 Tax=Candidatus Chlorohelix allophototropha TaxID=3003348 RepID=A0A8T7M5N6_9CHLR|nr:threonine/serine exporter family protein [Chloroflexota bacterium]WJW69306.1 threonine/serine exporter family protein [Chloroflexota bacterium L227-S17]
MDESDLKKGLLTATLAGEIMLSNGAETSRVEETVSILLRSFGIPYSNCLVTPTGMYISVDVDEVTTPFTLVRRVHKRIFNFSKIAAVNDLSRRAVQGSLTVGEIFTALEKVNTQDKLYPFWLWLLSGAGAASGGTLLLGGGALDAAVAFAGTLLVMFLTKLLERSQYPDIFIELFGAALATAFALAIAASGLPVGTTLVIAGCILRLVPGAALLASVQDGIAGDLLSSVARGLEAFLKGAAVASGVGAALSAATALGFSRPVNLKPDEAWQIPIQVVAAFLASIFFGISIDLPHRNIALAGIAGALCWLTHLSLQKLGVTELISAFIAAALVGTLSWGFARGQHSPVTLYILPGVLPLLPGLTIFDGMSALTQNDTLQGLFLLFKAIFIGGAIGVGVALSNSIAPAIWRKPTFVKRKSKT